MGGAVKQNATENLEAQKLHFWIFWCAWNQFHVKDNVGMIIWEFAGVL